MLNLTLATLVYSHAFQKLVRIKQVIIIPLGVRYMLYYMYTVTILTWIVGD